MSLKAHTSITAYLPYLKSGRVSWYYCSSFETNETVGLTPSQHNSNYQNLWSKVDGPDEFSLPPCVYRTRSTLLFLFRTITIVKLSVALKYWTAEIVSHNRDLK